MRSSVKKLILVGQCWLLILALFVSCSEYHRDPLLRQARDFMNTYFVMANQEQALSLTTAQASEVLQKEIELLKDVAARQESYRSRDAYFSYIRSQDRGDQMSYLFDLTIAIPDFEDQKKQVMVSVSKADKKITSFFVLQDQESSKVSSEKNKLEMPAPSVSD